MRFAAIQTPNAAGSFVVRLVGRAWFWVAAIALVLVLPVGRALFRRLPPMLPVLGEMPAFSLVDQNGEAFGSRDLAGRAWLGAMVSTSGPDGDRVGEELRLLQHRAHHLGVDFHIVAVTTDPAHDSPPDLALFLREHHASPRLWTFLTGDPVEVGTLITRLFGSGGSPSGFVLVDARQRIRSAYDPHDPTVVERVLFDLSLLVNRGG
jgi:protein SCO1/2